MTTYYKIRQLLLKNATVILLQNATQVYYEMRQVSCYEMRQFSHKIRLLLQIATVHQPNIKLMKIMTNKKL